MRKLLSYTAVLASAMAGLVLAAPASAASLDTLPLGSLSFKLFGGSSESNLYNANGTCNSPSIGSGCEVSWGVGEVTQVLQGITPVWQVGDSGQYLNYMLYGISDISVTGQSPNLNIDSAGASIGGAAADGNIHLDLYVDSSMADPVAGPDGRTGYGSYTGITGGTLWLSLILVPGCDAGNSSATLCQTLNAEFAPASGTGDFFAIATGGSAFGSFQNIQGQFDVASAAFGTQTSFIFPGACNDSPTNPESCFPEIVSDPVTATKVPEPSSLSLLGAAITILGGAVTFRRRKAKTKVEA